MPLDRLLALRVFAPLGMASTMYLPPRVLRERVAPTPARAERGFVLQRRRPRRRTPSAWAGWRATPGLFSTARDLAVFAQTMLNGGSYGTVRVLARRPCAAFTRRQPGAETRALGWDTPSAPQLGRPLLLGPSFGHTGYTGTSLWIDPRARALRRPAHQPDLPRQLRRRHAAGARRACTTPSRAPSRPSGGGGARERGREESAANDPNGGGGRRSCGPRVLFGRTGGLRPPAPPSPPPTTSSSRVGHHDVPVLGDGLLLAHHAGDVHHHVARCRG